MNCEKCSIPDADLFVGRLTAKSIAPLYDLTFGPDEVRDWGKEVEELRQLARELWAVCLRGLVERLAKQRKGKGFRDTLFEVLVARHLLRLGATVGYHPSEYGSSPVEFLVRVADHRALIECGHQSDDWFKAIEGKVRSRLKGGSGIDVLLCVPEVLDRGDGDLIEKRLPADVLGCAEQLEIGALFKGKLVGGRLEVRIRRTAGSRPSSVEWDWERTNWQDPTGLDRRRLLGLWRKTMKKFEAAAADAGDALRVVILGCEGGAGHRRWTQTLVRELLGADAGGQSARQYVDAVVLAWRTSLRLVEDLQFVEPTVLTGEAERQARLQDLFERLGICARPREDERIVS